MEGVILTKAPLQFIGFFTVLSVSEEFLKRGILCLKSTFKNDYFLLFLSDLVIKIEDFRVHLTFDIPTILCLDDLRSHLTQH